MSPQTNLLLTSVLGAVAVVGSLIVSRLVTRKQEALFAASEVDGLLLCEKVMIRDGFLECPGVAVVTNDALILNGVITKRRCIPLSQIKLAKETIAFRSHGWWRKHVLHLKAPGTFRLAIGVDNPEPWRRVFQQSVATCRG